MTDRPFQELKPLTKEPKTFDLGSFDIEGTGDDGGFISGAIMVNGSYFDFTSPAGMLDFMRRKEFNGYRFAAHNLSYDYGILEPFMDEKDYPLLLNGRPFKVSIARGQKHPRFLIDSLLFAGGLSLKKLGEAIHKPKLETPPELIKGFSDVPDWYCEKHNTLHCVDCYLQRDVEIVYDYMTVFQNTINNLGGELKFTLASTAMDLFRRKYLDQSYKTPFISRNEFCRNAYYGGRVEPYKVGQFHNINVYDINSLYPYVMRTFEYPNPNSLHGPTYEGDIKLIHNYEGVSQVTINIPNSFIPPLPYRHNGKLFFPTGTIEGHWTHVELRKAIELGCKILEVKSTVYAEETCKPFVNWVDDLYALRLSLKKAKDPRELVIKIMLNSLYGKFGQRTDAGLQEIKSFEWYIENGQPDGVEFRIIGDLVSVIVGKETGEQPDYVNTLWASYITSYARLTLLQYMLNAGDKLVYCDTDSLFTTSILETTTDLGGMKEEYNNVSIELFGPKAYRLSDTDGYIKQKLKGIPLNNRDEYLDFGDTTFLRPVGLLEAGRLNADENGTPYYPSVWREVTKHEHITYPKRRLLPIPTLDYPNFETLPHSIDYLSLVVR